MTIRAVNPATGETIGEYQETPPEEVDRILHAADAAFQAWRRTSVEERAALLREAATLLRERAAEYARLMALEMGKPITAGRAEVEKCALACDYYAENGPRFLEPERVETDARRSFVAFRPLGVVLAIMPWNFPFWQVFRFAAPALVAGNVGQVPFCL